MTVQGYFAKFEDDDFWICVTFPDVPEANTNGYVFDAAVEQAEDALAIALESYDEAGKPRPGPSGPFPGAVFIPVTV